MKKIFLLLCFLPLLSIGQVLKLNNNTVTIGAGGTITLPSSQNYIIDTDTISKYKLAQRYTVGTKGNFTTIAAAIDWLETHMVAPSELLLDGGNHSVSDSIGISLPYHLHIRGLDFQCTNVQAATGLLNKPMFNIRSDVSFERITFDGSTLASYGNTQYENCINITSGNLYCEITNFQMTTFHRGISLTGGSEIFVFNSIIDSCFRGIEVFSADTTAIDVEVTNFDNCGIGICLADGVASEFAITNCFFNTSAIDTAVYYDGTNYAYYDQPSIWGNKWNNVGAMFKGFDFTLASGRDANIVMISNIGAEDKNPHAKINLIGASGTKSFPAGAWTKLTFTKTSSYTCKWTIGTDSITYQPTNRRDVTMWISGAISTTSQSANIQVAIVKNHNTAAPFGQMSVFLDQNSRAFNFSTNVYVLSVAAGDVFSIWIKPVGTEDLIIQDLDWLAIAR